MRRHFPALLLVAVLATAAPLFLLDTDDEPAAASTAALASAARQDGDGDGDGKVRRRPAGSDPTTWQTSDRVIGPSAPERSARAAARTKVTKRFRYQVAPGVWAGSFTETWPGREVRYYVVTARYDKPGVGFRLGSPEVVARTAPTKRMVRKIPHSVAGVNGDFFDIGDTGAALGVGIDRGRLVNGRRSGWNSGFYFDADGTPRIGLVPVTIKLPNRTGIPLTNFNSAQVMPNGIGIYTPRWGTTSGYRWTDGQTENVRMIRVEGGEIVEKRHVFPAGQKFTGRILVARGARQTAQFDALAVGDRVRMKWGATGGLGTGITGNAIVLKNGKVVATDNRELHPRTAVGIDRKRHRIILLVVEGRQEFSDGYTMVEIARRLKKMGARAGLNLDGGGSSTMVSLRDGRNRVLNSPSDGHQRSVANALVVTYQEP
ncbi:phosphodiester glycosidase family protein [Nocardioides sp. YIM 152588]|uniref:phosphodiester glycosidase family protein n=1 Tax=Nocardioides sp. YIM 152588 TaxID=3158259 RepID=UPI0032E5023E